MSENKPQLPRHAKGKRPQFFSDPGIDQLYSIVLELSAELSVALDRIDTLEHLLNDRDVASLSEIQDYQPTEAVDAERAQARERYLQRIFRVLSYEAVEPADEVETTD
ncbi:MAG: hypothetical protein V3R81_06520 [Gammaproteobacteria bacterium]